MKKILIVSLTIMYAATAFCQQNKNHFPYEPQTDYLQKSKKQKTIAWLFIGGGAALVVAGAVIPKGERDGFDYLTWSDTYKNDDLKAGLIVGGALVMGGSIPFFIAAHRNKKKAMAASAFVDMEKTRLLNKMQVGEQSFAVAGIRIKL